MNLTIMRRNVTENCFHIKNEQLNGASEYLPALSHVTLCLFVRMLMFNALHNIILSGVGYVAHN